VHDCVIRAGERRKAEQKTPLKKRLADSLLENDVTREALRRTW
jgi:hypothetical protein